MEVRRTASRQVVRIDRHINDPEFADALVEAWQEITS
jgi:uncharacterized protein (UPF0261 family)